MGGNVGECLGIMWIGWEWVGMMGNVRTWVKMLENVGEWVGMVGNSELPQHSKSVGNRRMVSHLLLCPWVAGIQSNLLVYLD